MTLNGENVVTMKTPANTCLGRIEACRCSPK